jgi:hypothetical protein
MFVSRRQMARVVLFFLLSSSLWCRLMLQVSFTLKEVDPPKKGSLLTEISQKIEKEEKKFKADLVSNHQVPPTSEPIASAFFCINDDTDIKAAARSRRYRHS